jgi:cell division transport system permease protein
MRPNVPVSRPSFSVQPPLSARLMAWGISHLRSFVFSIGAIARAPFGSLLTALVIGISLAFPTGLYVMLDNVLNVAGGWGGRARVSLYLGTGVDAARAEELRLALQARVDIDSVELIDRAAALAEYRELSGFGDALATLEDNPLPNVLLVAPGAQLRTTEAMGALRDQLSRLPEVENAQVDLEWVERLRAITEFVQRAVFLLAGLLALAVFVIVGNTIRLAIANRSDEIEISLLFGGTNAFIRRPFLYNGLLLGVGGSLLAWALIAGSFAILEEPVMKLAELYQSDFELTGLRPGAGLVLIATGAALGLAGSWFAVGRYLAGFQRQR